MWKKYQVYMLSVDEIIAPTGANYIKALSLYESNHPKGDEILSFEKYMDGVHVPNPQHLYITSDEEIKENDWYLTHLEDGSFPTHPGLNPRRCRDASYNFTNCRKIVATTNPELWKHPYKDCGGRYTVETFCNKIPLSFVEEYVNRGGIKEIMLEINDTITIDAIDKKTGLIEENTLKLTPSGEITWSLPQKKYTREEVLQALLKCDTFSKAMSFPKKKDMIEWFDKNYPE